MTEKITSIDEDTDNDAEKPHYDLFFADMVSPCLRDEQGTMEFPFFSLEKKRRLKPIVYENNGVTIVVRGLTGVGIGTIWDADFLIWAASQLNDARERGEKVSPRLWFKPHKFMVQTRRIDPKKNSKGGKNYKDFERLLRRLQGTSIETNIKAGGESVTGAWSWIDSWKIHQDDKAKSVKWVEVTLADWFFRRIIKDISILAISPEYFLLTGGIERWLYKIARKHCGNNDAWAFSMQRLYEKYPPGRPFRKFKADLKTVVMEDCLPEYHVEWDDKSDRVLFRPRDGARENRKLPRSLR